MKKVDIGKKFFFVDDHLNMAKITMSKMYLLRYRVNKKFYSRNFLIKLLAMLQIYNKVVTY